MQPAQRRTGASAEMVEAGARGMAASMGYSWDAPDIANADRAEIRGGIAAALAAVIPPGSRVLVPGDEHWEALREVVAILTYEYPEVGEEVPAAVRILAALVTSAPDATEDGDDATSAA